jgi:hypothetical protein
VLGLWAGQVVATQRYADGDDVRWPVRLTVTPA